MYSLSEYLNKFVDSNLPSPQEILLEENIYRNTEDEIMKKLVETQSTVIYTLSAKSNNQYLNTLIQTNFSLPSNSLKILATQSN